VASISLPEPVVRHGGRPPVDAGALERAPPYGTSQEARETELT
jgi:hypothetical protein